MLLSCFKIVVEKCKNYIFMLNDVINNIFERFKDRKFSCLINSCVLVLKKSQGHPESGHQFPPLVSGEVLLYSTTFRVSSAVGS